MTPEERKAKVRAKNKAYYEKNRDRENKRCRSYHHANRDSRLAVKAAHREATAGAIAAYTRQRYYADLELSRARALVHNRRYKETRKRWDAANRDRVAAVSAAWSKANLDKKAAATARRRARLIAATPWWADTVAIGAIYAEAARLTSETGVKHEVDHVVPLVSRYVCGLHVHTNLRVITQAQNRSKHNRLVAA